MCAANIHMLQIGFTVLQPKAQIEIFDMIQTTKQSPVRIAEPKRRTPAPVPMHAAQFVRDRHACAYGSREYLLFMPTRSQGKKLPLIVMLHGCHQDAEGFAIGTRMNLYAEHQQCYIAYPMQASEANGAQCWNWYDAAHQEREQGEPGLIADLTRHLIATHCIDSDRVFVGGFSAGGGMAATLAVKYPELYAALGVHSGVPHGAAHDFLSAMMAMQHGTMASYAPDSLHAEIPTIVFHGDEDNMVHSTHAAQFTAPSSQCNTTVDIVGRYTESVTPRQGRHGYTRTVLTDRSNRIFSEQWIVHGGGHAWYGGNDVVQHVDARGPDATEEMLRFFVERTR